MREDLADMFKEKLGFVAVGVGYIVGRTLMLLI